MGPAFGNLGTVRAKYHSIRVQSRDTGVASESDDERPVIGKVSGPTIARLLPTSRPV
jgi:hypothetical protein